MNYNTASNEPQHRNYNERVIAQPYIPHILKESVDENGVRFLAPTYMYRDVFTVHFSGKSDVFITQFLNCVFKDFMNGFSSGRYSIDKAWGINLINYLTNAKGVRLLSTTPQPKPEERVKPLECSSELIQVVMRKGKSNKNSSGISIEENPIFKTWGKKMEDMGLDIIKTLKDHNIEPYQFLMLAFDREIPLNSLLREICDNIKPEQVSNIQNKMLKVWLTKSNVDSPAPRILTNTVRKFGIGGPIANNTTPLVQYNGEYWYLNMLQSSKQVIKTNPDGTPVYDAQNNLVYETKDTYIFSNNAIWNIDLRYPVVLAKRAVKVDGKFIIDPDVSVYISVAKAIELLESQGVTNPAILNTLQDFVNKDEAAKEKATTQQLPYPTASISNSGQEEEGEDSDDSDEEDDEDSDDGDED